MPPCTATTGENVNSAAAMSPTLRSGNSSSPRRNTAPTRAAATRAGAKRLLPNSQVLAAITAGHGGAYFSTMWPLRTPAAHGRKKSACEAGRVTWPCSSSRARPRNRLVVVQRVLRESHVDVTSEPANAEGHEEEQHQPGRPPGARARRGGRRGGGGLLAVRPDRGERVGGPGSTSMSGWTRTGGGAFALVELVGGVTGRAPRRRGTAPVARRWGPRRPAPCRRRRCRCRRCRSRASMPWRAVGMLASCVQSSVLVS